MYFTLFLVYSIIPPVVLYYCLKMIYQQNHKYGWHLNYLAKYFVTLSFLPILFLSEVNLAIVPKSSISILLIITTVILAILGIKPAMKQKVLYFYIAGVFAAFMEEILFRGVLFGLAQVIWNNTSISVIATSLAFGGWHLKNYAWHKDKKWLVRHFFYTGVIYGPLFALVRILTGDIYLAVFWHYLTDTYVALAPKRFRFIILGDRNKGEEFKDDYKII